MIVDSDAPTATVDGASMAANDTVGTNGKVPLHISWSTADATSGVVSGSLTVDSTQVTTGVGGPTTYSSADGTHQLQASATDLAGNTAMSDTFPVTQATVLAGAATLTKTWSTFSAGTPWGMATFSKAKGATASYTFTGTDVAWVSARAPKRGKAKVYIDGALQTVVDLKSSGAQSSVIVFVADGLAAGPHTIRIYVNGTSGRPRVDLDGFIVLSQ